jgi:hypothetical protein
MVRDEGVETSVVGEILLALYADFCTDVLYDAFAKVNAYPASAQIYVDELLMDDASQQACQPFRDVFGFLACTFADYFIYVDFVYH